MLCATPLHNNSFEEQISLTKYLLYNHLFITTLLYYPPFESHQFCTIHSVDSNAFGQNSQNFPHSQLPCVVHDTEMTRRLHWWSLATRSPDDLMSVWRVTVKRKCPRTPDEILSPLTPMSAPTEFDQTGGLRATFVGAIKPTGFGAINLAFCGRRLFAPMPVVQMCGVATASALKMKSLSRRPISVGILVTCNESTGMTYTWHAVKRGFCLLSPLGSKARDVVGARKIIALAHWIHSKQSFAADEIWSALPPITSSDPNISQSISDRVSLTGELVPFNISEVVCSPLCQYIKLLSIQLFHELMIVKSAAIWKAIGWSVVIKYLTSKRRLRFWSAA